MARVPNAAASAAKLEPERLSRLGCGMGWGEGLEGGERGLGWDEGGLGGGGGGDKAEGKVLV